MHPYYKVEHVPRRFAHFWTLRCYHDVGAVFHHFTTEPYHCCTRLLTFCSLLEFRGTHTHNTRLHTQTKRFVISHDESLINRHQSVIFAMVAMIQSSPPSLAMRLIKGWDSRRRSVRRCLRLKLTFLSQTCVFPSPLPIYCCT